MDDVVSPNGARGLVTINNPAQCFGPPTATVPWISIDATTVLPEVATIRFTVERNPESSGRAGAIRFASGEVAIGQSGAPCVYEPYAATPILIPAQGGSGMFRFGSNCSWSAGADAWIGISPAADTSAVTTDPFLLSPPVSNFQITYAAQPNAGSSARTGTIRVGNSLLSVHQAGLALSTMSAQRPPELHGRDMSSDLETSSRVAVSSIVHAATLESAAIAPEQVVILSGKGLGPSERVVRQWGWDEAEPAGFAGLRVIIGGEDARILLADSAEIRVVAPARLPPGRHMPVLVQNGGVWSPPFTVSTTAAAPGIFTADGSGRGNAAALNDDGSHNDPQHPSRTGSTVLLYITGAGEMDDGSGATGRRGPRLPIAAQVGSRHAEVLEATEAAGSQSGVIQLKLRIPDDVEPGHAPIIVKVGDSQSQPGVSIAVGPQ